MSVYPDLFIEEFLHELFPFSHIFGKYELNLLLINSLQTTQVQPLARVMPQTALETARL